MTFGPRGRIGRGEAAWLSPKFVVPEAVRCTPHVSTMGWSKGVPSLARSGVEHGYPAMKARPLLAIIRGPIGAGKTTLMRALARGRRVPFWALDTDAAASYHPADSSGEFLDQEWDVEIDLLALHARLVLGRGLNLVMDPGILLSTKNVDRFLRKVGRSRSDPRVVLFRLTTSTAEAVRRKTTLRPSYVRASHEGWVTRPVRGEFVIDTDGRTERQVATIARRVVRERITA